MRTSRPPAASWARRSTCVRRPAREPEARPVGKVDRGVRVVAHDEHGCLEWRLVAPPAPPPVVGPIASLGTELAASHDLGADALAPHAGQGTVQRDGGIRLIDAMDYPAVEPLEQPLGAADRGVERHMLAGGVAVEGDVHVVDPGPGHHDSFCDRAQRLTYRPAGWPGSSLALTSCSVAEPHTRITRDPAWSAGAMTAILTASPPRRYRAGTFSALPQGPGELVR